MKHTVVNCLIATDEASWDKRKVVQELPRDYARMTLATPINPLIPCDTPFWPYSRDGKYTVKTGYKLAHLDVGDDSSNDNSSSQPANPIWKKVWNARVQPKIKIFIWRLLNTYERLPLQTRFGE